jgi:GT2 family glycosyltransferase
MTVTVIVLAYGGEPYLGDCIRALLAEIEAVEIILVDNGAAQSVGRLPATNRLRIERPTKNLGFAGGCNLGASRATGEVLVFVNSDAIVRPGAVGRLAAALRDPGVALVSGGVRLADRPDQMNSVGNPVHFLGVVWAGGFGEPACDHREPCDIASASGAFFAIRRRDWEELQGFCAEYFAYHEDTELSLRAHQKGWRVVFVPDAVIDHHYEFSRNANKQYLLERNRWITVLTVFPKPVLALVLPAMVVFELPLAAVALRQGWFIEKARSWRWLVGNARWLWHRRRWVQSQSGLDSAAFAGLLSSRIEPAMIDPPPGLGPLNRILSVYWSVGRAVLCGRA